MNANTWIDVRLICDGTSRWLWQLLTDGALYGAGVAMSRTDAQAQAEERLSQLAQREAGRKPAEPGPGWATASLDLDQLDELDRIDRELGRRPDQAEGEAEGDIHLPPEYGEPVG